MSRARWIGLGALVLLLAMLPFVPRGGGDDGTIRTTGQASPGPGPLTAGYGRVTPAYRRTIDRVVDAGPTAGRGGPSPRRRARSSTTVGEVRDLRGPALLPRHRLDRPHPGAGARRTAVRLVAAPAARRTGDHDRRPLDVRRPAPGRPDERPPARAAAERAELTQAARSVAKVWLIRHQIQGVPLPHGFFARHPEVRRAAVTTGTTARHSLAARHQRPAPGQALARLPRQGRGPPPHQRRGAAPHLLVRPDHDADDHVGLVAPQAPPDALGPPARHHHQRHGDHLDGPRRQRGDRLRQGVVRRPLHHPRHRRLVVRSGCC